MFRRWLRYSEKRHNEIDIVILDVAMPGINGQETYRKMETTRAGTPVIFMTGYSLNGM
jgi:FixJ family two-component response regulator